jgi:hypothetical protein
VQAGVQPAGNGTPAHPAGWDEPGGPGHPWHRRYGCPECDAARPGRVRRAAELKAEGRSVKDIAAQLRVSTTVVYDDLKYGNLKAGHG